MDAHTARVDMQQQWRCCEVYDVVVQLILEHVSFCAELHVSRVGLPLRAQSAKVQGSGKTESALSKDTRTHARTHARKHRYKTVSHTHHSMTIHKTHASLHDDSVRGQP
eukprot:4584366-Amphidinium_carterae.2